VSRVRQARALPDLVDRARLSTRVTARPRGLPDPGFALARTLPFWDSTDSRSRDVYRRLAMRVARFRAAPRSTISFAAALAPRPAHKPLIGLYLRTPATRRAAPRSDQHAAAAGGDPGFGGEPCRGLRMAAAGSRRADRSRTRPNRTRGAHRASGRRAGS